MQDAEEGNFTLGEGTAGGGGDLEDAFINGLVLPAPCSTCNTAGGGQGRGQLGGPFNDESILCLCCGSFSAAVAGLTAARSSGASGTSCVEHCNVCIVCGVHSSVCGAEV